MTIQDFNSRLLVLEELCYGLELLPPYERPEPSEPAGAEPWNERDEAACAYYRGLEITPEMLAQVKHLLWDGGNSVFLDVAPFWDGEDDRFDIEDWSEIAALPALEVMESVNPLPPAAKRLLQERGVTVDDE